MNTKKADAIELANTAKRLKDNADFQTIMAAIEAELFASFRNTAVDASDDLNRVHLMSQGFRLIQTRIDKYIEKAKFEIANDED